MVQDKEKVSSALITDATDVGRFFRSVFVSGSELQSAAHVTQNTHSTVQLMKRSGECPGECLLYAACTTTNLRAEPAGRALHTHYMLDTIGRFVALEERTQNTWGTMSASCSRTPFAR